MNWPWIKKLDTEMYDDLRYMVMNHGFDEIAGYISSTYHIHDIIVKTIHYYEDKFVVGYFVVYGDDYFTHMSIADFHIVPAKKLNNTTIELLTQMVTSIFILASKRYRYNHNSTVSDDEYKKQSDFINQLNQNLDQVLESSNTIYQIREILKKLDLDNIEEKTRVDGILQQQLASNLTVFEIQQEQSQKINQLEISKPTQQVETIELGEYENCCIKATQKFKSGSGVKYCNDCGKQITLQMVKQLI